MKNNQSGFTLTEAAICLCIMVVVAVMVLGVMGNVKGYNSSSSVSWGINGMTEVRCIEGYKFVIGQEGQARQMMDELGKGVRCDQ